MVEAIKVYNIPEEVHVRFAHDTQLSEGAVSRDVEASLLASNATTVVDRGPKYSAFDLLFSLIPKGIVYSEPPPAFLTQLRAVASPETLFGSVQNLDSVIEVIRNVTKTEGKPGLEEEERIKLIDMVQRLKRFYEACFFVRAKIGSLLQG